MTPNSELELTTDPECVFIDGTLHFTFPRSEGMSKVTVTETQTGKENRMSALQSHAAGDAVLQRIDNNVIENCRQ